MITSRDAAEAIPFDGQEPDVVISHRATFDQGQINALRAAAEDGGPQGKPQCDCPECGEWIAWLLARAEIIDGALSQGAEAGDDRG